MPGFDVNRFENVVSDEFLCTICTDVLDDPLVTPHCEHIFCGACIKHWLSSGPSNAEPCCPIDRTPASVDSLRAPLRSFRNLLLGQNIRCAFSPACSVTVKLQNLADHEAACNYNPLNIEKEVECENKCGAKYKLQNKDRHNCVQHLQKEVKAVEDRANKESERVRQLEKENGKLTKKLEDGKRKWEETRLTARNELELKEEVNAYLTRQLEEAHEEIVRLKGQAAVAAMNSANGGGSSALRSRTASANGVSNGTNGNGVSSSNRPRSIAFPRDSSNGGGGNSGNYLTVTSSMVDTALLLDLQEFSNNNSNSNSNGETVSSSQRLSNSKFYSTSSSNISGNGTIRNTGSGSHSSFSDSAHSSNRSNSSAEGHTTTNLVKNFQAMLNRFSNNLPSHLPKMTVSSSSSSSSPLPSPLQSQPPPPLPLPAAASAASSASTSSTSSSSTSSSPPPPVPPPKPPKPKPINTSAVHHRNSNSNANSNNYVNVVENAIPSTSAQQNLIVLPLVENGGNTSGGNNAVTGNGENRLALLPPPPPPSPSSLEQLIQDNCKNQRVLQVLKMVNRRHFFPANEYYKPAATKKGAHAFTLAYEIRLLSILESYINSESRVLDIGSGMGFIAVCLAHLAKTVIGLEHVKSLVNKATEVVNSHYGNLSQQGHHVAFFPEDGRYGMERLGPYDLILVEPLVRQNVPEIILHQLRPGGSVVAVVKTDSKTAMYRITRNRQKKIVYQTLIDETAFLESQHKDYLCDIKQQESSFFNFKLKNLQL